MITGAQIAENLWRCPECGASPIDIFDTPFWLTKGDEQPRPIQPSTGGQRAEPLVSIVDTRLKLDLDEEKIALLIRSALLDDASNAGERLGALLAEISVDEDNEVCIAFETNFWPEDKEPMQALNVAKLLGLQVFQESVLTSLLFAWPGLGEMTSSTLEYTRLMLEAYASQSDSGDRD